MRKRNGPRPKVLQIKLLSFSSWKSIKRIRAYRLEFSSLEVTYLKYHCDTLGVILAQKGRLE